MQTHCCKPLSLTLPLHCDAAALLAACVPGYYSKVGSPKVCEVCPKEYFCGGGVAGGATKVPCGTGATTTTTGTQTSASCINKPGYGYYADTTARGFTTRLCPAGSYSAGGNKQPCTPCPAGLTTASDGSTSITQCSAPPGYFFVGQGKQPMPCAGERASLWRLNESHLLCRVLR